MTLPDYTEKNNICSLTERISIVDDANTVPILAKLQQVLFTQEFKDKDTFGLWNSLYNAFRKISQNNYEVVKCHLESSLGNPDIPSEEICFCNSLLEDISQDQNKANDVAWKIENVVAFYKLIENE